MLFGSRIRNLINTFLLPAIIFSLPAITFSQEITIVDDVRYVNNLYPVKIDTPVVSLEFERKFGGREVTDRKYSLHNPFDVAVNPAGDVYIVDSGNHRVMVYDSRGRYKSILGTGGSGPGSFNAPIAIDIAEDGKIYTASRNNNRVQMFTAEGRFQRQLRGNHNLSYFRILSNGGFVMQSQTEWSFFGDKEIQERFLLVKEFDQRGREKKSFGKPYVYLVDTIAVSDKSYELTMDREENVYLAYKHRNLIEKFDNRRKPILRMTRPLSFPETRVEMEPDGTIGNTKPNRISEGIDIDDQDRIWVLTYLRQLKDRERYYLGMKVDIFMIHVFNKEGVLLSFLPVEHYVDHIRIFGDRLYMVDTHREMAVFRYRIVEH